MTDPNDDLSSVADAGSMDPDTMTEPDNDMPGDLVEDQQHHIEDQGGTAGAGADSPATQGSPIGPPD